VAPQLVLTLAREPSAVRVTGAILAQGPHVRPSMPALAEPTTAHQLAPPALPRVPEPSVVRAIRAILEMGPLALVCFFLLLLRLLDCVLIELV